MTAATLAMKSVSIHVLLTVGGFDCLANEHKFLVLIKTVFL